MTVDLSDIVIRPMLEADLHRADQVWNDALATSTDFPQRTAPLSAQELAANLDRRRHLLINDPDGSFVALASGVVVGLAHSLRRGTTFGLAMLAVDPRFQDQRIGQALLERALAYAKGSTEQYIFSSSDPRALHRYVQAGFVLHPAVRITPRDDRPMTEHAAIRISQQTNSDLAVVDEIDQSVRGSTRRVDVEFWLRNEVQLVLHGGDGYALLGPNRVVALCAKTEAVASELLHSALSGYPDDMPRSIAWVVQDQQWAIVQAASDRATLEVHGAMMTRGVFSLPHPYLPNGLFT